jgi:hypothetical protein
MAAIFTIPIGIAGMPSGTPVGSGITRGIEYAPL